MYGESKYLSNTDILLGELRTKSETALKAASDAIACRDVEKAGHKICASELQRKAMIALDDFVSYYRHCLERGFRVPTNTEAFLESLLEEGN